MGGRDKGLVLFRGQPMVTAVAQRLSPQVSELWVNANRNLALYQALGFRVFSDDLAEFQGPLAGILTALRRVSTPKVVFVPCDAPLLPTNLVARLAAGLNTGHAVLAVAHDGTRQQPLFAMMHTSLVDSLQRYLDSGERKVGQWYRQLRAAKVFFPEECEGFTNINLPDDLRVAEGKKC
jgi:molybdopterin-guanine dinucleotide biosynthesis protein A